MTADTWLGRPAQVRSRKKDLGRGAQATIEETMIDVFLGNRSNRNCEGLTRRDFVRAGALAALGAVTLNQWDVAVAATSTSALDTSTPTPTATTVPTAGSPTASQTATSTGTATLSATGTATPTQTLPLTVSATPTPTLAPSATSTALPTAQARIVVRFVVRM